jgi:conjugative relaxase-like TrwC/TraI family protein
MLGAAAVKGPEQASYYTKIARAHDADYYAGGANLSTEWMGSGATDLGLAGPVGAGELGEVLLGHDPHTGKQLGRAFVESSASDRGCSARAWDVTFSVPKEVSAMWAAARLEGRVEVAGEIEEAVVASARQVVAEIEDTYATTRVGPAGRQAWTKVEGVTAASFLQPDSRTEDPQLHVHIVISTKVRRPDGHWGTLHPTLLLKHREALDRLGRAGLGAELRARLGMTIDTEARIPGVPEELCRALSTRRDAVLRGYAARLDEFRDNKRRDPSRLEAWRLRQLAMTESRPAKGAGGATTAVLARAQEVFRELELDRVLLLEGVLDHVYSTERPEPKVLAESALARLSERRSTWHRQDVAREVARILPDTWATTAAEVRAFVTEATDAAMRTCIVLEPGRGPKPYSGRESTSALAPHRLYCSTPALVETADRLSGWGAQATQGVSSQPARARAIEAGADARQADAAAAVAGSAPVALVVGPPGSGKTTVMGAGVAQLRHDGRPVLLATDSHRARRELEDSTGEPVLTIRSLRYQVDEGLLELPAGTTLILDEASMVSTPDMTWIAGLAQRGGHRVVMVGDPQQLPAVGRGGVFADLVAENPEGAVVLEHLWRFRDQEEAKTAMALWNGDPEALTWYAAQDRLVPVPPGLDGQVEAVADLWETSRARGEVEIFTDTNEQALAANLAVQQRRTASGEVVPADVATRGMHGEEIHAGDCVALRGTDADQRVITDTGARVYNRDRGVVVEVTNDAGAVVDFGPERGMAALPADQVSSRVELGYSMTCHGGQGVTVGRAEVAGTGIYWRSQAGDSRALLVGMTRGRDANFVIGQGSSVEDLEAELVGQLGRDRADMSPRAALRNVRRDPGRRTPTTRGRGRQHALAQAWAEHDSLAELVADARKAETAGLVALRPLREELSRREDTLRSSERRLWKAEQDLDAPRGLLRRNSLIEARTNLERAQAHVTSEREQLTAAQLALRTGELASQAACWTEAHRVHLDRLGSLDAQIRHLGIGRGRELADSPPTYLVAELGEPNGRNDPMWQQAASEIESYRARWGIDDQRQALPRLGRGADVHRQAVCNQLVDLGYSVGVEGLTRSQPF